MNENENEFVINRSVRRVSVVRKTDTGAVMLTVWAEGDLGVGVKIPLAPEEAAALGKALAGLPT